MRTGPRAERTGAVLLTAFGYDYVPGNLGGLLDRLIGAFRAAKAPAGDGGGGRRPRAGAADRPAPGGFILPGLADAHAHPAVGSGPAGLVALDETAARANLAAWAQVGITLVRDVGSPGGLALELRPGPGLPAVQAAGRFLAPAGRYSPDLLDTPVDEVSLVSAALARSAAERPGSR
jgi:hypothetical protein